MKKTLYRILIFAAALLLLTSCSGGGGGEGGPSYDPLTFTLPDGTEIAIDENAMAFIGTLGTPLNYETSTSCISYGLDKVYTYDGLEIQTYPQRDFDFVYSIKLTSDKYSTEEGIRIGSAKSEVIEAYGNPDNQTAYGMTFYRSGMELRISIRSGKVSSIQYVKTTE